MYVRTADSDHAWQGIQAVVQSKPDVIMVGDSSRISMSQRPGWPGLRAMQGERLCVFKQDESDMLVRAGPRMAEGA